jgi:hypothetical protein
MKIFQEKFPGCFAYTMVDGKKEFQLGDAETIQVKISKF